MSLSLTSCPRCMQSCSPLGQPGTWSFSFNVPSWSTEYVCGQCGVQPWFECCHSSCTIPLRQNVFYTLKQLRAHARHWHVQLASVEESSLVLDTVCCTDDSDYNCSYTDEFEDVQQIDGIPRVDSSLPFSFVKTGTAQFANWCIAGSVAQATRYLVLQSLLQAPVSVYLDTSFNLPPHSLISCSWQPVKCSMTHCPASLFWFFLWFRQTIKNGLYYALFHCWLPVTYS
jgi:hypothetical protein